MSEGNMPRVSDEAAKAFYGLSDADFAEQINRMAVSDPRLVKIFERTRERYLKGEFAHKHN